MYSTRQLANLSPRCLANLADAYAGRERKLAHNTYVRRDADGAVVVRFHATDILRFDFFANEVTVNSGGHHTVTTKQRLNALLPAHLRVTQQAFAWYVNDYGNGEFAGSVRCLFEDGDTFDIDPGDRPAFEVVAEYTVAY